jgi:hypothetical protein
MCPPYDPYIVRGCLTLLVPHLFLTVDISKISQKPFAWQWRDCMLNILPCHL